MCNTYGVVSGALHFNQFIHHLKTIKKFIKLDSALGYTQQNPPLKSMEIVHAYPGAEFGPLCLIHSDHSY